MSQARTVLVVDDDPGSRRLLSRWLEEHGWRVLEAPNGVAALTTARDEKIDLVFLDVRMPGALDGLQTAVILRENSELRYVPVIAVSASAQETFRHRALAAGCSAFLSKPVNLKLLMKEIERFVPLGEPQ
ncbi:MAG: response regulator [Candidatus Acidiferrales bacterium]